MFEVGHESDRTSCPLLLSAEAVQLPAVVYALVLIAGHANVPGGYMQQPDSLGVQSVKEELAQCVFLRPAAGCCCESKLPRVSSTLLAAV
jgi:hypothetical protein